MQQVALDRLKRLLRESALGSGEEEDILGSIKAPGSDQGRRGEPRDLKPVLKTSEPLSSRTGAPSTVDSHSSADSDTDAPLSSERAYKAGLGTSSREESEVGSASKEALSARERGSFSVKEEKSIETRSSVVETSKHEEPEIPTSAKHTGRGSEDTALRSSRSAASPVGENKEGEEEGDGKDEEKVSDDEMVGRKQSGARSEEGDGLKDDQNDQEEGLSNNDNDEDDGHSVAESEASYSQEDFDDFSTEG